jgi:uncharacterized 2Fe-2S/4Fe-4S cluster protein (DUF4445 family)
VKETKTHPVRIELSPLGEHVEVESGMPLQNVLFDYGVEFPCGGRGQCRGCRVRVVEGDLPINAAQREILKPEELADGWRLSCQCRAETNLQLELALWKTDILIDETLFDFTPQEGLGIAIDLGTTTIAVQLVDLSSGQVLGVRTALNAQARHGADVMSRVEFAVAGAGALQLQEAIRAQVGQLARQVLDQAFAGGELRARGNGRNRELHPPVTKVVIVGNTVMHHLFCGVNLEPLSHYPFETQDDGLRTYAALELGWELEGNPSVRFLPCLGGFVGSDILAGILAVKMHESSDLLALVDLGTNGEIVVGNRKGLICASTAAGPAFEGARIWMGMRAATGAIYQVRPVDGRFECRVLGNTAPRGICGSGLVDAVAAGLDLGLIEAGGRISGGNEDLDLEEPVKISQTDIRQLQLAKGAIAAGISILLERFGACREEVATLYLAGAFGNYISRESARRIGLIDFPPGRVHPAGNTALLGAKMALFQRGDGAFDLIRSKTEHISLSSDPNFMDTYVEEMGFPKHTPA